MEELGMLDFIKRINAKFGRITASENIKYEQDEILRNLEINGRIEDIKELKEIIQKQNDEIEDLAGRLDDIHSLSYT